jgi:hypothetical protein
MPTATGGLTALVGALLAGSLTVAAPSVPDAMLDTPRTQAAQLPGLSSDAPVPDPQALAARLEGPLSDPVLGNPAVLVVDAMSGRVLFDRASTVPAPPASILKIAVAGAALATFAPDARLRTTVRYDPANGGTLWLVGAGDPTLTAGRDGGYPAPARLADLARQVRATGITTLSRVVGDGSVFEGPSIAPGWRDGPDGYVAQGNVAPVTGLEVDGGRSSPGRRVPGRGHRTRLRPRRSPRRCVPRGWRSRAPGRGGPAPAPALEAEPVSHRHWKRNRGRCPGGGRGAEPTGARPRGDDAVRVGQRPGRVPRAARRPRTRPARLVRGATRAVLDVLGELGVPTGAVLSPTSAVCLRQSDSRR